MKISFKSKFTMRLTAALVAASLLLPAAGLAATNFLWGNVGSTLNLLTTELNALANNAGTSYGPEVGGNNEPQRANLVLHLASSSSAFTSGSYVSVYLVPSVTTLSGGTYPTYTSGTTPVYSLNGFVGNININPKTQSANVVDEVLPGVIIPLGFFKTILISSAGVTLPASGNTLNAVLTPTQY